MFSYIKGNIVYIEEGVCVIECGGIGYEVFVSNATAAALKQGRETQLFTYMQVRDDALNLYGFVSMEEKRMFLNLLSVSGIGCKVALSVLSGITPKDLALSIAGGHTDVLSSIKGIGKKTAARIVLELKEKVAPLFKGQDVFAPQSADGSAVLTVGGEAMAALAALGLSRSECAKAVESAVTAGMTTTEEIIGFALKNLGS